MVIAVDLDGSYAGIFSFMWRTACFSLHGTTYKETKVHRAVGFNTATESLYHVCI